MLRSLLVVTMLAATACGPASAETAGHHAYPLEALPMGIYRLEDNGIRCVRAPCPSIDVRSTETDVVTSVSDIRYPAGMPDPDRQRLQEALFHGGFTARGEVDASVEGGVFVLEAELRE